MHMDTSMEKLCGEAVQKARDVLTLCSTRHGLYASAGAHGYTQVWSRDSNVSMIGASFNTSDFKGVFARSLSTLASRQSKNGQIPNATDFIGSIDKPATFATIDSSLWFILGEHFYKKRFGSALWEKHKKNIGAALKWVQFQDAGEDMMPEQLPTSDWQDCFPHKYGHTINTQALYYAALSATGHKKILPEFKKQVDRYLYDSSLGYFLPWHWKDHEKYRELEKWFDSLGNMLAIVFGLADKKQSKSILKLVEESGVAEPYPMRAIYPPIHEKSAEWHGYFKASLAGVPNNYINGGIWPYIGGFYVCALVESGRLRLAEDALESLAHANMLGKRFGWDFNEWIHPITGTPGGSRHQAWSAGSYLLAYEAVKKRKNPLKIQL